MKIQITLMALTCAENPTLKNTTLPIRENMVLCTGNWIWNYAAHELVLIVR